MNKRILHISLFLMLASTSNVLAQQGIGTHTPHRSAALQIESQNKGILIPRMNLGYTEAIVNNKNIYTITAPTITSPVNGLLVYNQNDVTKIDGVTTTVIVPQGFYYYDGSEWNPISKSYLQDSAHTTISGKGSITEPYTVELKPATIDVDDPKVKVLVTNTNGIVEWAEQGMNTDNQKLSYNETEKELSIERGGDPISLASLDTNTTYTGGVGIKLEDTEFSVPVTLSPTSDEDGNVITNVEHTADGITVTKSRIEITDTKTIVQAADNRPITVSPSSLTVDDEITYTIDLKVGSGLAVDEEGVLNATVVDTDTKTIVAAGTNVTVTPTIDPVNNTLTTYTVDVAKATISEFGVVKQGSGLYINEEAEGILNLGGPLTEPATIITNTNDFTIATTQEDATGKFKISGLENTKQVNSTVSTSEISTTLTNSTINKVLVVDANHTVKTVNAVMPEFFYMPSIVINTQGTSVDLYQQYLNQFGKPMISNTNNEGKLPVLDRNMLDYHITYYDTSVLQNVSINDNGVMTYGIIPTANLNLTFINVVFKVRSQANTNANSSITNP